MHLRIAGEEFLLDWPQGPSVPGLLAEFYPFAAEGATGAAAWRVSIEAAKTLFPFVDESRNARLEELPTQCRIVLKNGQWALLDYERHELRLFVDAGFFCEPTAAFCTLSSFLRLVLSVLLPKRGGLVLHASSVADGPVARVFAGVSGAGKSTVCALAQGRALFGDEIALLSRDANGGYWVHPGPFFAEESLGPRALAPLPLDGLYLLKQAHEAALSALPFTHAVTGFLQVALMAGDSSASAEALLDGALALWRAGRIQRLEFRKSPDFWPLFASRRQP